MSPVVLVPLKAVRVHRTSPLLALARRHTSVLHPPSSSFDKDADAEMINTFRPSSFFFVIN